MFESNTTRITITSACSGTITKGDKEMRVIRQNEISVLKFGGTSVKTPSRMKNVAEIVAKCASGSKVIVVVSAMGHHTDELVNLAAECSNNPIQREMDVLLATGEQQSIALLSIVLNDLGVKTRSFTGAQLGIITESNFGNAEILQINRKRIESALDEYQVIVVAGFQGVTTDGDITTLGRGGSDTSAVALAAAIGAQTCDIFTDVDGIYTADPNKVASATMYEQIGYTECLELALNGAQVIHPRAVRLAQNNGLAIRVRNTFNPENLGTLINGYQSQSEIAGITTSSGFGTVDLTLETQQSNWEPVVRELCGHVQYIGSNSKERTGDNLPSLTLAFGGVSENTFSELATTIARALPIRNLNWSEILDRVTVVYSPDCSSVGPYMKERMRSILSDANIEIKFVQATKTSMSCLIASNNTERALNLLHEGLHEFAIETARQKVSIA